jgi:hypothetical protein
MSVRSKNIQFNLRGEFDLIPLYCSGLCSKLRASQRGTPLGSCVWGANNTPPRFIAYVIGKISLRSASRFGGFRSRQVHRRALRWP